MTVPEDMNAIASDVDFSECLMAPKLEIKEEANAETQFKIEHVYDQDGLQLSESVIAAQLEAEQFAEQADADGRNGSENIDESGPLLAPRLLQLPASVIEEKTVGRKAKGQQLDLLLLKAESYSHFILENQRRSKLLEVAKKSNESVTTPASGKRKTAKSTSSSNKKTKGKKGDDKRSAEAEVEAYDNASATTSSDGFHQPTNLVGGTLMPYQLEGLQWLLSLWENGLSGILAGEQSSTYHVFLSIIDCLYTTQHNNHFF
jgi:SNF2 family DNA or RNA helicase